MKPSFLVLKGCFWYNIHDGELPPFTKFPSAPHHPVSDTPEQSYVLMAHIRGKIELLQELPVGNKQGTLQIQSLPGGIAHFVLLDKQRIPLSERLLFIPQIDPKWQITQDKDRYARRSLVRLNLRLTDTDGNPLQGDFSISITDNYAVNQDSLSGDIRSALLLTSDLKGNVETPGYYFGSPNRQRQIRLDNLMLTHGWSRFQVNDLLQKDFTPKLDHYLEIGQALSGMVRSIRLDDEVLMDLVTEAFPIVVFTKQLENKKRRLMEIMECEITPDGKRHFNSLFRYEITEKPIEVSLDYQVEY